MNRSIEQAGDTGGIPYTEWLTRRAEAELRTKGAIGMGLVHLMNHAGLNASAIEATLRTQLLKEAA